MTPQQFIAKWKHTTLKERSASQSHFNDLCALVGHPTPVDADPTGEHFTFERGASKTGGGEGWADVWKKGCFAWEYKGKHKDLTAAFAQLQRYAIALQNPPLLVVSDMETIIIHTNFTNTIQNIHTIALEEIELPESLQKLRWLLTDPERFRPGITRQMVTERAAQSFAGIAQQLRDQGYDGHRVAHFVNKLIFSMFAEDIGILPGNLFTRMVESVQPRPDKFAERARLLFGAMRDGGEIGFGDVVPWFNGGLFDDDDALPLDAEGVSQLLVCAALDWSDIEPAIFGTLFERGLDPSKRSQLGAHYTDQDSIMRLVGPVVIEPLEEEWKQVKGAICDQQTKGTAPARKKAQQLYEGFLARLRAIRVLDPACGSGNFLYLSLVELKNLEHRVMLEGETFGFQRDFPLAGPQNVLGIEINDYAAELARVTVWIGDLQWSIRNGLGYSSNPILKKLDTIECRDALLNIDGTEATWPAADCIVGNPPFLGGKKMLWEMGSEYVNKLRGCYKGRVPGGADLVTYWFEKARAEIEAGRVKRAGLVATNSIRGGANCEVLKRICNSTRIFRAWSDEPWVNEGAAVHVSLLAFGMLECEPFLDGQVVSFINPDLTSGASLTNAKRLIENSNCAFVATVKAGPFDIPGDLARSWLSKPNPNGKPNSDVVRPWINGMDITRRPSDTWVVDFGVGLPLAEAMLFEEPFQHVNSAVASQRNASVKETKYKNWWLMARPIPAMRKALQGLSRCIVTPVLAKHRLFAWMDTSILADHQLIVIARSDDTTFGILHSRFHELWSLRLGTALEDRPRYTPTTTFETFPFPVSLTPSDSATDAHITPQAETIAIAARRLSELRENWLNPPEWVDWVITPEEEKAGFPRRPVAKAGHEADLSKRTLTNLYNARPPWLVNAHSELDSAVAAAYDWPADISDEEVLRQLLVLNLNRAGE